MLREETQKIRRFDHLLPRMTNKQYFCKRQNTHGLSIGKLSKLFLHLKHGKACVWFQMVLQAIFGIEIEFI